MAHLLPQNWQRRLTKVGSWLGALGLLCATGYGADPTQLAEQAKQRLNGNAPAVAPAKTSDIQQTSMFQEAPAPMAAPTFEAAVAEEATPPAPWSVTDLFDRGDGSNFLKDNQWRIGGNIAQSFAFNFQGPRDKWNGPVTWTDRSNEYQLNQFWLTLERTTDTSKNDWDLGGRIDAFWGTNARLVTASGLETNQFGGGPAKGINPGNGIYGWAFPNLYAELAIKKLKIRAGRFVSPIGYFTADTTQNFFNTIPYTYQWGEPFTHTGVNMIYQASDNLAVSGGIIRGWDNFDNSNPFPGLLATWAYTFQDKSNLAQVIVLSREPNFNFSYTQRYYQSLVYTKPINDDWTYVGQSDFGTQKDPFGAGKAAHWYGLNQYLYRKINDRLTFGFNFEWWRDEQGYRVGNFLPSNFPSGISSNQRGWGIDNANIQNGYNGNFFQVTFGPKWHPTGSPNFFVRPNMRFDWYQGGVRSDLGNTAQLKPFDDGGKNYQTMFVTDLVFLF